MWPLRLYMQVFVAPFSWRCSISAVWGYALWQECLSASWYSTWWWRPPKRDIKASTLDKKPSSWVQHLPVQSFAQQRRIGPSEKLYALLHPARQIVHAPMIRTKLWNCFCIRVESNVGISVPRPFFLVGLVSVFNDMFSLWLRKEKQDDPKRLFLKDVPRESTCVLLNKNYKQSKKVQKILI